MYQKDEKRMREFWRTLQDVWLKLYGSFYPTAAAIAGHAPAGGCLLALGCEYRVMCPKFTIGLNETKLGIVAPFWFMNVMRRTISNRIAENSLTEGSMFSTEEALRIGLVDELGNDKADAIAKCEIFLNKFSKIPSQARGLTKQQFRAADIKELENAREEDINRFITFSQLPEVQKSLGLYLDSLKNKK
jgi:Delta3-Delta2-enoyl-CoA isomerase